MLQNILKQINTNIRRKKHFIKIKLFTQEKKIEIEKLKPQNISGKTLILK